MADAWQSAWVEVVPDFSGFKKTANKQMTGMLGSAGDDAGKRAGKGIGGGIIGGIGKLAAPLAIAFAGLGIGKLLGDSIASASDLNEAGTAVEEIFGPAYSSIQTFARGADKALGQSNLAALNAAKSFGIFGQAAGLTAEANADFSIGLTGLATDLASFNNTTPEQAIEAIGAALRGESEPLRQYGVLLDDATLRAKALELGIYSGSGALTQQQRILAAEAAIYDQTAVAQGDFAKTSEGLANQQRILAAQFENTKAKLGEALLPAMTSLATMANDTLVPILDDLIVQVGPVLSEALASAAPAFTELLAAIIPLIPDMVTLIVAILPVLVDLLTLLAPTILTVVSALTGFFEAIKTTTDFLLGDISLKKFLGDVTKIGGPVGVITTAVANFGFTTGKAFSLVISGAKSLATGIRTNVGNAVTFVTGLPGRILAAVGSLGTLLFSAGQNLITGLINGIKKVASGIADAVLAPVKAAVNGVKDFLGIKSPSRLMFGIGENTGEGLILGVQSKLPGADAVFQSLVSIPNVSSRIDASVSGAAAAGAGAGAGTYTQYNTFEQTDPTLQARQAGREFQRLLAS